MAGTIFSDTITTNALPDALRTVYSSELEFVARPQLVFDQPAFVEPRDDFSAKKGEQVIWTVYHQLPPTFAPLTENQDVVGGTVTDHQVSFKVWEYGNAIGATEALDVLSYHGPISNIVRTLLAPQQALTMDTLCRNVFWYAPNRSLLDSSKVGAMFHYYIGGVNSRYAMTPNSSIMTADTAKLAALHLSVRRIPTLAGQTPSYLCITHPSITYDLRSDPYWKDAQLYAGATEIFNGEEGMIHGVRFVKSDRARIANGGNYIAQTQLTSNVAAGANSIQVSSVTNFAVGQEVTLHNTGVSASQGGNNWIAPDGQDTTTEELIIKTITGSGPYTVTFTNPISQNHNASDYMTEAQDVYPMVFLGGLACVGKGIVVPPEIRVSLPTDKLRRINYIGWYALMGYGVIRDYAYEVVEALASQNVPPVFSY